MRGIIGVKSFNVSEPQDCELKKSQSKWSMNNWKRRWLPIVFCVICFSFLIAWVLKDIFHNHSIVVDEIGENDTAEAVEFGDTDEINRKSLVLPVSDQCCSLKNECKIICTGCAVNDISLEIARVLEKPRYIMLKKCVDFIFGLGPEELISDRFVLTAAHCFRELPDWAHVVRVRLGEWDLKSEQDCNDDNLCTDKPVDVDLGSYVVHEDYDSKNHHNDVALIKLAKPVTFTEFISPVCLPLTEALQNQAVKGKQFTVIGWGTTERGQEAPGVYGSRYKLEVDVLGADSESCREKYPKLEDSELCAGGEAGKDSCQGDSGGCLVAPESNGYWYQYGVVSWGYGCGTRGVPGVYARVSSFVDWIKKHMK